MIKKKVIINDGDGRKRVQRVFGSVGTPVNFRTNTASYVTACFPVSEGRTTEGNILVLYTGLLYNGIYFYTPRE